MNIFDWFYFNILSYYCFVFAISFINFNFFFNFLIFFLCYKLFLPRQSFHLNYKKYTITTMHLITASSHSRFCKISFLFFQLFLTLCTHLSSIIMCAFLADLTFQRIVSIHFVIFELRLMQSYSFVTSFLTNQIENIIITSFETHLSF